MIITYKFNLFYVLLRYYDVGIIIIVVFDSHAMKYFFNESFRQLDETGDVPDIKMLLTYFIYYAFKFQRRLVITCGIVPRGNY